MDVRKYENLFPSVDQDVSRVSQANEWHDPSIEQSFDI